MAEAIVSRFTELLDDLSKAEKSWLFGGKVDNLKKTVSALQNVVRDAEKRSLRDDSISEWLGNLKAAFYDAEDLLEEWNDEVMPRKSLSKYERLKQQVITFISPLKQPTIRVEMRARAKDIRGKIEAIAKVRCDFQLLECAPVVPVERGSRKGEWSDSFVYDEEIIGREDDKRAIMKFLLDSDTDDQISIFAICGEEGMGKTSLARCLYKDGWVNRHFDLRMWVSVGTIHSLEDVLRKIIRSVTTERADGIELEQLQTQLTEVARGKKYLLILDDVLPFTFLREEWESLTSLLMGGAKGSKILLTGGDHFLVPSKGKISRYFLRALSESSSLDLLMRMACKEEEETRDSNKLTIGRHIVKKCGGIPLAIRTIGAVLFLKQTEAEWLDFAHEIPEVHTLYDYLELSYHHLPSHLKQCFAFCSLFPRDWVIDKQMLTSLWMAEGFIRPIDDADQDLEDIAHDYFMILLRWNFFEDCTKDELGKVISCKMHGLMYQLACDVAYPDYVRTPGPEFLTNRRVRHASSVPSSSWIDTAILFGAEHLRTLINTYQMGEINSCDDKKKNSMCEETLCKFISTFKFLRALDWHDSGIEKLPSSISELKYLTFLDLSENEGIIRLPDSVTRLQTLQVLKLNMCYKLIELPRDIRKLVNLRQLEISNCSALSYMPHGLGKLTLLRTLTHFILPGDEACQKSYGGLGELSGLNKLRGSLNIEVKGESKDAVAESKAASLKEKNSLVSLVLVFPGKESDEILLQELQPSLNLQSLEIRGYGGTRFPSWMSCMPKLVQLRLFDCTGCKSLPSLCELTSLKHLEIGKLPIVEYAESDINALPSLPNLSTLRIWECPIVERIPPLPHLEELKLPCVPLESLHTSVATIECVTGIGDQVKEVINLLKMEDNEVRVRIVGIHGTNGSGKTTIAKAVYDRLSSYFDRCSFLAEIGETTEKGGGIQFVQTKLIRDILERDGDVASLKGGIEFFLDVFRNIKVLIVLDDVEEQSHLDDLVGDQLDWFASGSRIIVTSEKDKILQTYVSRRLARIYEVNKMSNDHAFELFHKHALGTHSFTPEHFEIGKHIVEVVGQFPFIIEVVGSLLRGRTIEDWRKLEDLIKPQEENSREFWKDCKEILKICYQALDKKQKQIFWDIARFASGVDARIASYMWRDRDPLPSYHVLMPLAKLGEDNMLGMHKLLKDLSGTIDQEEFKYPGRRRRPYMHETDPKVLNRKEGIEEVEALCFDCCPHTFMETDFKGMPKIRFLKLDHASMTGNFANAFPKLRWLRWQDCPRDFEATEFNLDELVILDLSWSKLTEDWGGWKLIKMEQLKVLNLTGCTDLLISPTFSSFPNLEILILQRCSRLVHLDPSVGGLKKLLCLNLKSCTELSMLPAELGGLEALKELLIDDTQVQEIPLECGSKKLETLSASNCLSLSFLPHSFELLTALAILSVDNSKITKLPSGVGELVKLRRLSLRNCRWIRELPESIGKLGSSLEQLDISGTGISNFPDSFGNLRSLRVLKMDHCFVREFPNFIGRLLSLEEIHASSCRSLRGEIPRDIGKLKCLRILRLQHSGIGSLPSEIKYLSKLETLDLLHCDKLEELPALPSGLVIVRLSPKLKRKMSTL